jgi:hypothetical protein
VPARKEDLRRRPDGEWLHRMAADLRDTFGSMENDRFGQIDFDRFHREELPKLLEARGQVFSHADASVVRPLAFRLDDGRAYTYRPIDHSFVVEAGDENAHTVVEMAEDQWCAFAWELRSCFALLYAEQLAVTRGSFGQMARWEPPLRVAFDGQAVYDIDDPPELLDASGEALDFTRTFTLADPHEEAADFLSRAGFVHLREVMDRDEIEALRADVTAAIAGARPDDRRSWWTTSVKPPTGSMATAW